MFTCGHCEVELNDAYGTICGNRYCYGCLQEIDRIRMQKTGRIQLFQRFIEGIMHLENWTGTLRFRVNRVQITGTGRYQVAFVDDQGNDWRGHYTETQLPAVRCASLRLPETVLTETSFEETLSEHLGCCRHAAQVPSLAE